MNDQELLQRMVAPGTRRAGKYREGVIQIHVTRACDKACFACTQGSNLAGKTHFMPPEMFEQAVRSLGFGTPEPYFGVVGVFGGNPALSPHFAEYCDILRRLVPFDQRGIWSNNPVTLDKAQEMARTFDPSVSNLNVHLDKEAYRLFKLGWPQCYPVGLDGDSRHSPVHLAMKDVLKKKCQLCLPEPGPPYPKCEVCHGTGEESDDDRIRELVAGCDINQHWSAMLGMFRGQLRAWFCEVAGAQSILHQDDPSYPDTGYSVDDEFLKVNGWQWWKLPMYHFANQVRKHCWECGVPLRGYGELSQSTTGFEQTSVTHEAIFRPKCKDRKVELVTNLVQLDVGKIQMTTRYLQNAKK